MSDIINAAVTALNEKLAGAGFDGSAKFEIEGEGTVRIDETGASASEADADVTLTADAETFQAILEGEQNATAAFMTGKLSVDGDMGMAMKLGAVLS
ncbi:MAG: SCP2 sterol-binding domain-containing protein [Planktotalea sp.]|jgi:putative sterol carrier protein|uniref:SCP2 sterol-binding domain-containing protein n=1 Tax=Planktotalea sp. TaxID=2029877 RepID=UPI000183A6D9|nr:SCP2 sterol-binding domain-containing protein [Planktotalea sp.]EDZ41551.1 sterol carrier family protein [Rhodobacteraceae bacterium HTCC2083]MBT5822798.1 SCP2 sterol-binding domain-containing protein [Paracoccaceae bacterium]MDG1076664.1 SCP2 sterol-binding domain-containing protein [Planktotalea sp.]MDG1082636.1 SCP2 sterol-binding domain-containing protein [Planktotalea sp.]HCW82563.1 sterol carrier family protein [Paracoccaceae bacterium]